MESAAVRWAVCPGDARQDGALELEGQQTLVCRVPSGKRQSFEFNHVFSAFDQVTTNLVPTISASIDAGLSCNVLVAGTPSAANDTLYLSTSRKTPSLVSALVQTIFSHPKNAKEGVLHTISFCEVYDGTATDLLLPEGIPLNMDMCPEYGGGFVKNLLELVCGNSDELLAFYREGSSVRAALHKREPSRACWSHSVCTIHTYDCTSNSESVLRSRIVLCDISVDNGSSAATPRVLEDVGSLLDSRAAASPGLASLLARASPTTVIACVDQTGEVPSLVHEAKTLALVTRLTEKPIKAMPSPISIANVLAAYRERIKAFKAQEGTPQVLSDLEVHVQVAEFLKSKSPASLEKQKSDTAAARIEALASYGVTKFTLEPQIEEQIAAAAAKKERLLKEYKAQKALTDETKQRLQEMITHYGAAQESGQLGSEEAHIELTRIKQLQDTHKTQTMRLRDLKAQVRALSEDIRSRRESTVESALSLIADPDIQKSMGDEQRLDRTVDMQLLLQSEQDRLAAETAQKTNEAQIRALMTGSQGSLLAATEIQLIEAVAEKQLLASQVALLEQERKMLLKDIEDMHARHKRDIDNQRNQHFEAFRKYRMVLEEQRHAMDEKYRGILEQAVKESIHASSLLAEARREGAHLKEELAIMKAKQQQQQQELQQLQQARQQQQQRHSLTENQM